MIAKVNYNPYWFKAKVLVSVYKCILLNDLNPVIW